MLDQLGPELSLLVWTNGGGAAGAGQRFQAWALAAQRHVAPDGSLAHREAPDGSLAHREARCHLAGGRTSIHCGHNPGAQIGGVGSHPPLCPSASYLGNRSR
jgi:hypothetical protein